MEPVGLRHRPQTWGRQRLYGLRLQPCVGLGQASWENQRPDRVRDITGGRFGMGQLSFRIGHSLWLGVQLAFCPADGAAAPLLLTRSLMAV